MRSSTRSILGVLLVGMLFVFGCGEDGENGDNGGANMSKSQCCSKHNVPCESTVPKNAHEDCTGNEGCKALNTSANCYCGCAYCYDEKCVSYMCAECRDAG